MALFSRTKKTEETQSQEVSVAAETRKPQATDRNLESIIVAPRITEKSVKMGDSNVYTFVIAERATKFLVRDAVKALYGVTPVKVNIVRKRPALRLAGSKNKMVKVPGMKKAYVYLKKGDTINLV